MAGEDLLYLSLPFLDAPGLSLVCRLSRSGNSAARSDEYWEPIVLEQWPGAVVLQGLRGNCYELYSRRHRLEKVDMVWPAEVQYPNPDDYFLMVELNVGQRTVHSSLLGLRINDRAFADNPVGMPPSCNLMTFPGQHFQMIPSESESPEGIDNLCLSALLLRKEDKRLMRICNGVKVFDHGESFVTFETFSFVAVPPCLAPGFAFFRQLPSVRLDICFIEPVWQGDADRPFLCGFGSIGFRVTLGTDSSRHVRRGGGGIDGGGDALLRFWHHHGIWV